MEFQRLEADWKQRKREAESRFSIENQAYVEELKLVLQDPDLEKAADAAEALGWIRDGDSLQLLIDKMASEDEWLRDRCSFAIARMPRMGLPLLLGQIAEFEGPQLEHGIKALVRMKAAAQNVLCEWLQTANPKERNIAHKALCQLKFPLEMLFPALEHENKEIRKLAIDILGKSRNEAAIEILDQFYVQFRGLKHQLEVAMSMLARHLAEEIFAFANAGLKNGEFKHLAWQALAKRGFPPAFGPISTHLKAGLGKLTAAEVLLLRNFHNPERSDLFVQIAENEGPSACRALLELIRKDRWESHEKAMAILKMRAKELNLESQLELEDS